MRARWTGLVLIAVALGAAPAHGDTLPWANKNKGAKKARSAPAAAGGASPAANAQAAKDAFEVHASGRIEFHARNLAVADAFAQLRQLTRRNIIVAPEVTARFTGDLYDVTLRELIDAVCRTADLTVREEGSFLFIEQPSVDTRLFNLNYVRAADVMLMIEPLLSPEGKLTATISSQRGIRSSQDEAGGDDYANGEVLLVMDHAKNLARIESALRRLDVRPRQVLIEATICSADVTNDRSLGVEFTSLAGVNFTEAGATSKDGTGLELGSIPANGIEAGLGAGLTNLLDGLPTTGLNVGVIKDNVGVFLRALQEVTKLTVLANPKVLALNKQRGEVIIGRRDGYLTTTVTQTASIQNVEFLETGTRLLFRPFIGADGYVRLEIHPEDSNGGISDDGLPFKETAEVTTNIMVRTGQTVVIGGLFREVRDRTQRKVPGLGDLPGAGALFRSNKNNFKKEEIIILLTPRILGGPDPSEDGAAKATTLGHERLLTSYLGGARRMISQGRFAEAATILDAAEGLARGHPEIARLRQLVSARPLPPSSDQRVDQRILECVHPGQSTPRGSMNAVDVRIRQQLEPTLYVPPAPAVRPMLRQPGGRAAQPVDDPIERRIREQIRGRGQEGFGSHTASHGGGVARTGTPVPPPPPPPNGASSDAQAQPGAIMGPLPLAVPRAQGRYETSHRPLPSAPSGLRPLVAPPPPPASHRMKQPVQVAPPQPLPTLQPRRVAPKGAPAADSGREEKLPPPRIRTRTEGDGR